MFKNFNPPFTNSSLDDFFNFKCDYSDVAADMRKWILNKYPEFEEGLKYHVPFYSFNKKALFYFHYFFDVDKKLCLEISFAKGGVMLDNYKMFSSKNSHTKAISIPLKPSPEFLEQFSTYIDQAKSIV